MSARIPENMRPVEMPALPAPGLLEAAADPAALFAEFERVHAQAREDQEANFNRALKRMNRCAFWHGFGSAFIGSPLDHHYAWCPAPLWDEYWQASGWPKLPSMNSTDIPS